MNITKSLVCRRKNWIVEIPSMGKCGERTGARLQEYVLPLPRQSGRRCQPSRAPWWPQRSWKLKPRNGKLTSTSKHLFWKIQFRNWNHVAWKWNERWDTRSRRRQSEGSGFDKKKTSDTFFELVLLLLFIDLYWSPWTLCGWKGTRDMREKSAGRED